MGAEVISRCVPSLPANPQPLFFSPASTGLQAGMDTTNFIALDTETTGVDVYHGAQPFLITISNDKLESSFWEWDVNPLDRQVKTNVDDVKEIIEELDQAEGIVLQNGKFDVSMFIRTCKEVGIEFTWPWEKTHDTLLLGHLLASNHDHSLKAMAIEYLAVDISKFEKRIETAVKKARNYVRLKGSNAAGFRIANTGLPEMPSVKEKTWQMDMWLPRLMAVRKLGPWEESWLTMLQEYANADSATTIALFKKQIQLVEERQLESIYAMRREITPIVYGMEKRGITANLKRVESLQTDYLQESATLGKQLCERARRSYRYVLDLPKGGTNKNLTTFIFKRMKLPPLKVSAKTGAPSLDANVLRAWGETLEDPAQLEVVNWLSQKRKRDTALTYLGGYARFWKPLKVKGLLTRSWRVIHPNLNITGTHTLRFSSNNPNEQNISKKEGFNLRKVFGPAPGREWWSLDAKNIELRIPAYESGEQELIKLFETPNEPPYYGSTHLLNFHTVYPDIWDAELKLLHEQLLDEFEFDLNRFGKARSEAFNRVGPHCKKKFASTWYQWCKNGGFAVQYGAVDLGDKEGTADKAFHRRGAHAKLKSRFGRLEKLNQKCIIQATRKGYVETIPDKHVDPDRGYPLLCSLSKWGRVKDTVPLNYHVQGTAMWWMCMAMIRCEKELAKWRAKGFNAHIALQVHDELVFDLPKGKTPEANLERVRVLAKTMELGGEGIGVPTPVSIEYHPNNWSEGVTYDVSAK